MSLPYLFLALSLRHFVSLISTASCLAQPLLYVNLCIQRSFDPSSPSRTLPTRLSVPLSQCLYVFMSLCVSLCLYVSMSRLSRRLAYLDVSMSLCCYVSMSLVSVFHMCLCFTCVCVSHVSVSHVCRRLTCVTRLSRRLACVYVSIMPPVALVCQRLTCVDVSLVSTSHALKFYVSLCLHLSSILMK